MWSLTWIWSLWWKFSLKISHLTLYRKLWGIKRIHIKGIVSMNDDIFIGKRGIFWGQKISSYFFIPLSLVKWFMYEKPMTYFPFLLVMVNMNIALRTKHNVMVCTYSLLIIKKVATQTRGASLNVTILQIYLCFPYLWWEIWKHPVSDTCRAWKNFHCRRKRRWEGHWNKKAQRRVA